MVSSQSSTCDGMPTPVLLAGKASTEARVASRDGAVVRVAIAPTRWRNASAGSQASLIAENGRIRITRQAGQESGDECVAAPGYPPIRRGCRTRDLKRWLCL